MGRAARARESHTPGGHGVPLTVHEAFLPSSTYLSTTYGAVVAPTPSTTAATKEDVATLRRIIEESERRSEERMKEMRALIKNMTAAVSRQPNVSKDVKNALPQLEAIIDHLEVASRDGNEAWRKL